MVRVAIPTNIITITLIGLPGVGKTTYIKRIETGEFIWEHIPGSHNADVIFETNQIPVTFSIIEETNFQTPSQAYILMFDLHNKNSFDYIKDIYQQIIQQEGTNVPIVIVGNKMDFMPYMVKTSEINSFINQIEAKYYPLSVKTNYNWDKPFEWIAKKLVSNNIQF